MGSALAVVLLHVLQLDMAFGTAMLAVPPLLALVLWTVMRVLLRPCEWKARGSGR